MSDHPDHPAKDDFPADFFDDVSEPSPVLGASAPTEDWGVTADPQPFAGHTPEPNMPPIHAAAPVDYTEPTAVPKPLPHPAAHQYPSLPPDPPRSGTPAFAGMLGTLILGGIGTAMYMTMTQPTSTPPPAAAAAPAAPVGEVTAATPAPTDPIAAEVKELKGQLDSLSGQLKGLMTKVESLPKPPEPVDLAPVQGKIDDLAKSVATVTALSDKVGKLDERLGGIDGGIKTVNEKVAALSEEVKKAAASPTVAAIKPEDDQTATALAEGAGLFKAGKYKEANDVFKKLEAADAKDARVYYYAALANGLTTKDWQNETVKIAAKGAELEKAGTTKPADVDAAFADLPANLKPWLTFFRKAAK